MQSKPFPEFARLCVNLVVSPLMSAAKQFPAANAAPCCPFQFRPATCRALTVPLTTAGYDDLISSRKSLKKNWKFSR